MLPEHIAIVMDGNGRWAKRRGLPRMAGHKAGASTVRKIIEACRQRNIKVLTLFAFSTENWNRPQEEVNFLMEALFDSLQKNTKDLVSNNVKFNVIGDFTHFSANLQSEIIKVFNMTAANNGLYLNIALNYSGRWDITQAVKNIASEVEHGSIRANEITSELFQQKLCLSEFPAPDLFIRTGGELRISNFMLWQLAYTELYFTEIFWPEFKASDLDDAIVEYSKRERRFGGL